MNNQSHDWQSLSNILRLELQEYGGLLDLLIQQQKGILGRDPETLMDMNLSIQLQSEASDSIRKKREQVVRDFAIQNGIDPNARLSEMLSSFPDAVRPLIEALIDDVLRLIRNIRHKAGQNNMLLHQACDITDELLRKLEPRTQPKTYGNLGRIHGNLSSTGLKIETTA